MAQLDVTIAPATRVTVQQLSELLNRAYADYFLPVYLDASRFVAMCREEDVLLDLSVVALAGVKPVGISLLSRRGTRGWVSGVGVLPAWRRMGIARRMMATVQATARRDGFQQLTLEVLTQNASGRALYRDFGFVPRRDLLVLLCDGDPQALEMDLRYVVPTSPVTLLTAYEAFHPVRPPWQRELQSLRYQAPYFDGLGFWDGENLLGYVLYSAQLHYVSVVDLAVDPTHPRQMAIAHALLVAMHRLHPIVAGYMLNIAADDPLLAAFMALGYRVWQRQTEMLWVVDAP